MNVIECNWVKYIGGWVYGQVLNFLWFNTCYSPDFLVFRMGSFVSQLSMVVEILCDEVGHYAHFSALIYRKMGVKIGQISP